VAPTVKRQQVVFWRTKQLGQRSGQNGVAILQELYELVRTIKRTGPAFRSTVYVKNNNKAFVEYMPKQRRSQI